MAAKEEPQDQQDEIHRCSAAGGKRARMKPVAKIQSEVNADARLCGSGHYGIKRASNRSVAGAILLGGRHEPHDF